MSKTLCIYHGNCADGFGAAWAVRHALGTDNVEFHAGIYQDPPPDVTDREVIIVDFSFPYDVLVAMSYKARSICVVDHHKTASEALGRLPFAGRDYNEFHSGCRLECQNQNMPHIGALFDMERSGAGMAWDFFNPGTPRPRLIDHIEDRDLWRFKLPLTREIQAAVFSYPYDFATWEYLMLRKPLGELALAGEAIERKHHKDVGELLAVTTRKFRIRAPQGGVQDGVTTECEIELANLPYTLTSDAGHELAKRSPHGIGGCYWDTPSGRVFSLRAAEGGLDVSAIAKLYGGGGHKAAAGFRVPFDQLAQFEIGS